MQLTAVGKEIWRAARKAEQLEEAGADNPAVQARLQKLRQVEAFRKHRMSWPEIQSLVGISRATYYRWQRRLKEEGLKGLAPKPRRPRHLRQKVCWTPDLLVRIEALRKQHPTWGRWPIWLTLRKQSFQSQSQSQGQGQAQAQAQAQGQSQRLPGKRTHRRPHPGLPGSPRPRSERSLLPGPGKAGKAEEKEEEALRPKEAQSLPSQPPW